MKKLIDNFMLVLGTGFGSGYLPRLPGTSGTVVAFFIWYFLFPTNNISSFYLTVFVALLAISVSWHCEAIFKIKDDQRIVIDEFAGFFVSVLFLPKSLFFGVLAFVMFRFFDIKKPFGIKKLQTINGGVGVVADDIAAGILVCAILNIWHWFF
ncbi:MAG: phosphatidylglycerophosphatase A [Endomicrobiales bacterium]|nr:phosphatidylglycerophosphatase A [Endomicrobiales bacterium]